MVLKKKDYHLSEIIIIIIIIIILLYNYNNNYIINSIYTYY